MDNTGIKKLYIDTDSGDQILSALDLDQPCVGFLYYQIDPSSVWVIKNEYPINNYFLKVFNGTTEISPNSTRIVDDTNIEIAFSSPIAGVANVFFLPDSNTVLLPTPTNILSLTPTPTLTPTTTVTPTLTPTLSLTPSITPTNTITLTNTRTVTKTATLTPSITFTVTPTLTITPTTTTTTTNTLTVTPSKSFTPTATSTPSTTVTITPTKTITPTNTLTITRTPTSTTTPSTTATNGSSPTPTLTATQTVTTTPALTQTANATPTSTATATITPTVTLSLTPSITPTNTLTPSLTVTNTNTKSNTPTLTRTISLTPTPSATVTNTPTPSLTQTKTTTITPTSSVTQTVTPTIVGMQSKWSPGHYVWVGDIIRSGITEPQIQTTLGYINELASDPTVRGVQMIFQWSALEGATAGDYTAGIALVTRFLNACSGIGKQFMLSMQDTQFGGYGSDLSVFFPAYIVNNPAYGTTMLSYDGVNSAGIVARVWQAATMDRIIARQQAYAVFESNPNFEMLAAGETAIAVYGGANGFSNAAVCTQMKRLYTAMRAVFPTTQLRLNANYLSPDSALQDLIAHCAALKCAIGGPDTLPAEDIQANRVFTGALGGIDYRGVIPFVSEIQSPELGGKEGTYTPSQLFNHAMIGNASTSILPVRSQYFVWYRNTFTPDSTVSGYANYRWATGILPFIRSITGNVGNGLSSISMNRDSVPRPSAFVNSPTPSPTPTPTRTISFPTPTVTPTIASREIKFNPGHYATIETTIRGQTIAAVQPQVIAFINSLATKPSIKGVQVWCQWSALEGAVAGDYAAGIAMIQSFLNACAAVGKRLIFNFIPVQYGGYGSDWTYFFPAYIVNGSSYGISTLNLGGLTIRSWQSPTIDRVIALHNAYAAAFNSHPNFEMVVGPSTSVDVTVGVDGYSYAAHDTQNKRLLTAMRAAYPNTCIKFPVSTTSTDAAMQSIITYAASLNIAIGGTDMYPNAIFQGNQVFSGVIGGINYRGIIPFIAEMSSSELGGGNGTYTNSALYSASMDGYLFNTVNVLPMFPQYFIWSSQNYLGGDEQKWTTGVLPYIESINGFVSNGKDSIRRDPSTITSPYSSGTPILTPTPTPTITPSV